MTTLINLAFLQAKDITYIKNTQDQYAKSWIVVQLIINNFFLVEIVFVICVLGLEYTFKNKFRAWVEVLAQIFHVVGSISFY